MSGAIVGALACQRNSFLFDGFKATVVSCEKAAPLSKKSAKKTGDESAGYDVELSDTILFPEGGGQPSDTGSLLVEGRDTPLVVSQVSRQGLRALHRVSSPVEPGTAVTLSVDKQRRFDFMQQHTGQHLLSALLEQKYSLDTLSWSMATPDVEAQEPSSLLNFIELPKRLTPAQVDEINNLANEYIMMNPQGIKVSESQPAELDETSKIPDDYDFGSGVVRTVHIGTLDANQCCGTHLASTAQIGSLVVFAAGQTTVRSTNSRLYFTCGLRVSKYASLASDVLAETKQTLSCSETQLAEGAGKLKAQLVQRTKGEQFWARLGATQDAERIAKKLSDDTWASLLRDEYCGQEYLNLVYKEFAVAFKERDGSKPYRAVLAGYDKAAGVAAVVVVADSGEGIEEAVGLVTAAIPQVRGGGGKKGGKWQGKATAVTAAQWTALCEAAKGRE